MTSQYDKIKTAKELIEEIRIHGFSTVQEDVCRAQDIFGHSPVGELVEIASGSHQDAFYMVLFHIWNWRDATAFYNEHSNPDNVKVLKEELSGCKKELKNAAENIEKLKEGYSKELENNRNLGKSLNEFEEENRKLEDEIIRLKAKLYDSMVGGENNG